MMQCHNDVSTHQSSTVLLYCCCFCQRVMPSSTPPRPASMPLSPSSSYPPMPGGQVVYPSPQPPPSFVSVPQSQSNQRVTAGHQNKRGIWILCESGTFVECLKTCTTIVHRYLACVSEGKEHVWIGDIECFCVQTTWISLLMKAVPSLLWHCWLNGRKGIQPTNYVPLTPKYKRLFSKQVDEENQGLLVDPGSLGEMITKIE